MSETDAIIPLPLQGLKETDIAPKALVVIPVYNHVNTLRAVVEASLAQGFPVLVVDDGSSDGSLDSVTDLPAERHRLPVNVGKGGAILAAARLALGSGYQAYRLPFSLFKGSNDSLFIFFFFSPIDRFHRGIISKSVPFVFIFCFVQRSWL